MLPKIRVTWKKLKIKVVRNRISSKKVYERICLPSWSGTRGIKRLIWLKNCTVQKWKNTFNTGLNVARNTHHMEKNLKWKLFGIEFRPKKSTSASVHSPPPNRHPEWSWRSRKNSISNNFLSSMWCLFLTPLSHKVNLIFVSEHSRFLWEFLLRDCRKLVSNIWRNDFQEILKILELYKK